MSGLFRYKLLVICGGEQASSSLGFFSVIFTIQEPWASLFTFSGEVASSPLTSVTVPDAGANRSDTALTDSTVPNVLPAVSSAPTFGVSTNTMSPRDCCA